MAVQTPREKSARNGTGDEQEVLEVLRTLVDQITGGQYRSILTADLPLLSSGIVDSLALVELVDAIDERFGCRISEGDLSYDIADSLRQLAGLVTLQRD